MEKVIVNATIPAVVTIAISPTTNANLIRDLLLVLCLLAGWYILRREKLTRYQIAYRNGYLRSEHWQEVRRRKLKQAGYKCEKCGEKVKLDIHHKTYERLGKERLSDLQALCRSCHQKAEKRKR